MNKDYLPYVVCYVHVPKNKKLNGDSMAHFLDNLLERFGWISVNDFEHELRISIPLQADVKKSILEPVQAALDQTS